MTIRVYIIISESIVVHDSRQRVMHYRIWDIYLSIVWVVSTYLRFCLHKIYKKKVAFIPANVAQHRSIDTAAICKALEARPAGARIKVDRTSRAQASNSMRFRRKTGSNTHTIKLGPADRVLYIDTDICQVTVEPGATMEQLVDVLLPHKLVPFVVPEFRALTVGGVLAGAGIESSSWNQGQFGDSLVAADYVLADGSAIHCTPQTHPDLFYGALGACGTLGLLVSATLKVRRVSSEFVSVRYYELPVDKSIAGLNAHMQRMTQEVEQKSMIDAIVYRDHTVIVVAEYDCDGPSTQSFSRGRDPWFYQHVSQRHRSKDVLHIKDYLFRYDAGAFWMSQYAISPLMDFETLIQQILPPVTDPYTKRILSLIPFGGYNWLSRWLLSPLLKTAAMYTRLHQSPIVDIAESLLIQDVYIPVHQSDEFLSWLRIHLGAEKIWLCPMQKSTTPQIFSPHHVTDTKSGDNDFINFGVWMHKTSWRPSTDHAKTATIHLERKVASLGGRKMLYSLSHYSKDEWRDIYDEEAYARLKTTWDPDYAFGDIYEKVGQPAILS